MIYENQEVLDYLLDNKGKLIHLYGEADAGRTSVLFSLIENLTQQEKIICYITPRTEEFRKNVFDRMISYPERCIIAQASSYKEITPLLSLGADIYMVDNFLEQILHKKKPQITHTFSLLSGQAFQNGYNIILSNDLRISKEKGIHPAYMEYFRHFCSKHIEVKKDSDFHIHYNFTEI